MSSAAAGAVATAWESGAVGTVLGTIASLLWTTVMTVLKVMGLVLSVVIFLLWFIQGQFLYLPSIHADKPDKRQIKYNPPAFRSPATWGLPYEEIYITTKDQVRLHAWLILHEKSQDHPTLLFYHENAGNIGTRLPSAREFFIRSGFNILLLEYRGYGNSEGSPSEAGLVKDGQAALDYLISHPKINPRRIFLFGRSLGGAVAIHTGHANNGRVCGVIVENTFTNIEEVVLEMADRMFGARALWLRRFHVFLYLFLSSHWCSDRKVKDITCPMLFISGLCDEIIPSSHMKRLHETATTTTKKFFEVPEGMHNDTYVKAGAEYYSVVNEFVRVCLGATS